MNEIKRLTNGGAWVLSALLGGALVVWMLTGCTTYRDHPRARGGYYEDQPSPGVAYVAAPQAETSYVGIRTESDFYEPLSPYGHWEVVGSDGRCWIPARVDRDWRPYSNGYWQRTDAGWYWASDEPWGWATYHYGRWDLSPQFGWYWVPQTQWAPAWVSWHQGGGYVGWAPLRPSSRFGRGGSIEVDVRVISPRAFVFVEERQFLQPVRPTTVVVNNTTIINKTVNITNIKVVNKTVINEGPRTTVIEQASGQKVQPVPVRELRRKQEAEVVAKQRVATPASDKKEKQVQTPVRTEAEPRDTKAAPANEPRQVAQPVITTAEPQPPVTKKDIRQADQQDRAAKFAAEQRARQEKARATEIEKGRSTAERRAAIIEKDQPAVERRATIQEQREQKAAEKRAEQLVNQTKEADKKAQQVAAQRAKEEQAASEKARKNAEKEDQNKKGKEQEASPEDPDVSPQSPQ